MNAPPPSCGPHSVCPSPVTRPWHPPLLPRRWCPPPLRPHPLHSSRACPRRSPRPRAGNPKRTPRPRPPSQPRKARPSASTGAAPRNRSAAPRPPSSTVPNPSTTRHRPPPRTCGTSKPPPPPWPTSAACKTSKTASTWRSWHPCAIPNSAGSTARASRADSCSTAPGMRQNLHRACARRRDRCVLHQRHPHRHPRPVHRQLRSESPLPVRHRPQARARRPLPR